MNTNPPAFSGPNQGRFSRRMADLEAQLRQANRELKLERERNKVLSERNGLGLQLREALRDIAAIHAEKDGWCLMCSNTERVDSPCYTKRLAIAALRVKPDEARP